MNLHKNPSKINVPFSDPTILMFQRNSARSREYTTGNEGIRRKVNFFPRSYSNLSFIVSLIVIFVSASSFATEYTVPDDYPTITEALEIASDGDLIHIAPGIYSSATGENFPLRIVKEITLMGDPYNMSELKGDSEHTVVLIGIGGVTLQDLRITDGVGSEGTYNMDGGGICVFVGPDETNPVKIRDCIIENNTCLSNEMYDGSGGGIYCSGTYNINFKVRISNCTIHNNIVSGQGGGIFCAPLSNIDMDNTLINDNTAFDSGGGVFVDIYASINTTNTNVISNNCSGDPLEHYRGGKGGGLFCESYVFFTAIDCIFAQNMARYFGGCIYACGNSQSILQECEFRNNHVYDLNQPCEGGGAYFTNNSTGQFIRCTFRGNTTQKNGGGIAITENSNVSFKGTLFTGNIAYYNGGSMYFTSESEGTLTNCTLALNSSIYGEAGAGIYLEIDNTLNIDSSIIWQNSPDGIKPESNPNVNYSCLQRAWPGIGNIVTDPKLDLHTFELQINSPCIDAGNPDPSMNDACLPPGKGLSRNDMGIKGGPENCVLSNGLIAYYPFNGNANDESGNNHHGDVYGAEISSDMYDNINSAYSFNGYYDYIDVSSISDRIPVNHTRCAWIKTEMDGIGEILDTGNYANDRGCYFGVKDNKLMVGGSMGNFQWNNVLIDVDVTDGNWHFVCATYENGNSSNVYMDGEFIDEAAIQYSLGNWITYIGKNHKRDIQYFHGIIDQVRVYNRILSDSEIQTLCQLGI